MKKLILALLPEKWLTEIYYRGYSDAGSIVKTAAYWFTSCKPIYEAMLQIGQNLYETKGDGVEQVRAHIYGKYKITVEAITPPPPTP